MAKKEFSNKEVDVAEEVTQKIDVPITSAIQESTVSFDRWFSLKGFKAHWKTGMKAYTDTTVRRTVSEWNKIFENY